MTEAHGPPRGSAPNGLPSFFISVTTPLEAVAGDEVQVIGEALMARQPVFDPADRPVQHHALHHFRVRSGERRNRRTAHAAAHEMRARDAEMIEQTFALRDEVLPGHRLDAPARLSAFAAVEHDAGEVLRQMFDHFGLAVDAERRPRLHHRVEAAGGVHQERGA